MLEPVATSKTLPHAMRRTASLESSVPHAVDDGGEVDGAVGDEATRCTEVLQGSAGSGLPYATCSSLTEEPCSGGGRGPRGTR